MTKFLQVFILTSTLLFCGYAYGNNPFIYSKHEIIADKVIAQVAKDLSKIYNLQAVGYGGSMHEDVEEMSLSFSCHRKMTRKEYRKLIVNCSEYFLNEINSNEELRPHLHNFPFTSNHILLFIFVFSENGTELGIGQLSCVSVIKGKVNYSVHETEYTVKTGFEEPYSEALRLVKEAGMVSPLKTSTSPNQNKIPAVSEKAIPQLLKNSPQNT